MELSSFRQPLSTSESLRSALDYISPPPFDAKSTKSSTSNFSPSSTRGSRPQNTYRNHDTDTSRRHALRDGY